MSLADTCSCSQDLEDPVVCGGAAGRRGVHAEHVPQVSTTQPRAAAGVRSLQPPAHPQQGENTLFTLKHL